MDTLTDWQTIFIIFFRAILLVTDKRTEIQTDTDSETDRQTLGQTDEKLTYRMTN